jgi:hypothetical protein
LALWAGEPRRAHPPTARRRLSELGQVPPDRDAPLRADVSYLGRLLGQVLVEQDGEGLLG